MPTAVKKKKKPFTCRDYEGRPDADATEVERWNGRRWIPDDGKPGIAFSGKLGETSGAPGFPAAWYHGDYWQCALRCRSGHVCTERIAGDRTVERWHCSNGRDLRRMRRRKT